MGDKVLCNICLLSGKITIMQPKDDTLFKCPECENETYPEDMDIVRNIRYKTESTINNNYRSCSLPEGVTVHGGGDSTGKSKKEAMKKLPLQTLNDRLYKQT